MLLAVHGMYLFFCAEAHSAMALERETCYSRMHGAISTATAERLLQRGAQLWQITIDTGRVLRDGAPEVKALMNKISGWSCFAL